MASLSMKVVPQLSVALDNKPGQLAKMCKVLADAGVNVEGMSTTEAGAKTTDHLIADKTDVAKEALEAAGFSVSTQDTLAFVCPEDRPGVIATIATACGDAGVNISKIYTGAGQSGAAAMVYICVDQKDLGKAKEACAKVQ